MYWRIFFSLFTLFVYIRNTLNQRWMSCLDGMDIVTVPTIIQPNVSIIWQAPECQHPISARITHHQQVQPVLTKGHETTVYHWMISTIPLTACRPSMMQTQRCRHKSAKMQRLPTRKNPDHIQVCCIISFDRFKRNGLRSQLQQQWSDLCKNPSSQLEISENSFTEWFQIRASIE